jgi:hypothetical protein
MTDVERITDFGAKIGGAAKDTWEGVVGAQLEDTEPGEHLGEATDTAIDLRLLHLGAPDYFALVHAGMPAPIGWLVRKIVQGLPRGITTKQPYDARRAAEIERAYVDLLQRIRARLFLVRTIQDLVDLFCQVMPNDERVELRVVRGKKQWWVSDRGHLWLWALKTRGWNALIVEEEDEARARAVVSATNWPPDPASARATGPGTAPRADAAPDVVRFVPEVLARTRLPDIVLPGELATKEFQRRFGFRGGEFGNYASDTQRRAFLHAATVAFEDLASLFGTRPQVVSLYGLLAIAYGARGRGGATIAHYEPAKRVFNFTRDGWVGTLAHEWFHALDHFLATQLVGESLFKRRTHMLSRFVMAGWRPAIKAGPDAQVIVREWNALLGAFGVGHGGHRRSAFFSHAAQLDETQRAAGRRRYWTEPHELMARAFEAWVYDALRPGESP